jgi:hypothetical protein
VKYRIDDKHILRLIKKWLKAGVVEDGKLVKSSSGSPQGGVVSPVLANIYLHYVLDLWVSKVVPKYLLGEIHSFRYADDVLFCFQYRNDAIRFMRALKQRLNKFGLSINEEKSKLCRFGRYAQRDAKTRGERRATFNFLGFTFYNGLSRQGKYKVGCKTQSKRLSASLKNVTKWCKENRHQAVAWQSRYLNAVLTGHYNYFGVTGNYPSISKFYRGVLYAWKKYLGKRSQRAKLSWEKFMGILKTYPLLKAHLPRSIYTPVS